MFITIEYLDEWDILGKSYKTKRISVFAIGAIEKTKDGCKITVAGFMNDFHLKISQEEFESICEAAVKKLMPEPIVSVPEPLPVPVPITEPPAPIVEPEPEKKPAFAPIILELERKDDEPGGVAI